MNWTEILPYSLAAAYLVANAYLCLQLNGRIYKLERWAIEQRKLNDVFANFNATIEDAVTRLEDREEQK